MTARSTSLARRLVGAALFAALLSALVVPLTQATGGSDFVSLTNVKRASVGVGPVVLSASVDRISDERAAQMATADQLAHNLTYVANRLGQLGICWAGIGEIIAWEKGYPSHSYQRTIDDWWASLDHHAIMVGAYTIAGGSWAVSASGATYSVMIFVKTCAPVTTVAASTAPTIVSRSPASGATGVSLHPAVTARFSTPVTGVSTSTFVLRDAVTGTILPATVSYDASTLVATLRPSGTLWIGRWYRVALSGSIRDSAGQSLAYTSWQFRATTVQVFNPVRTVAFAAGRHVGYRFSSTGAVVASKAYTLSRASSASTSKRAVIAGHAGTWLYITNGVWAGYWVQASSSVILH